MWEYRTFIVSVPLVVDIKTNTRSIKNIVSTIFTRDIVKGSSRRYREKFLGVCNKTLEMRVQIHYCIPTNTWDSFIHRVGKYV